MQKRSILAAGAVTAGLVLAGTTGAVAGGLVGSADIRNNTIRQVDVKDGGLGFRDFNTWTKNRIDAGGEQGPAGPAGADGVDGTNGTNGVSGYEVLNTEVRVSGAPQTIIVSCPEGKVALGGGFEQSATANGRVRDTQIQADAPVYAEGMATGWKVVADNKGDVNVKAWVTCAAVN